MKREETSHRTEISTPILFFFVSTCSLGLPLADPQIPPPFHRRPGDHRDSSGAFWLIASSWFCRLSCKFQGADFSLASAGRGAFSRISSRVRTGHLLRVRNFSWQIYWPEFSSR